MISNTGGHSKFAIAAGGLSAALDVSVEDPSWPEEYFSHSHGEARATYPRYPTVHQAWQLPVLRADLDANEVVSLRCKPALKAAIYLRSGGFGRSAGINSLGLAWPSCWLTQSALNRIAAGATVQFEYGVWPLSGVGQGQFYGRPAVVQYRPESDSQEVQVGPACRERCSCALLQHSEQAQRYFLGEISTHAVSSLQLAFSTTPIFFVMSKYQTYIRSLLTVVSPDSAACLCCSHQVNTVCPYTLRSQNFCLQAYLQESLLSWATPSKFALPRLMPLPGAVMTSPFSLLIGPAGCLCSFAGILHDWRCTDSPPALVTIFLYCWRLGSSGWWGLAFYSLQGCKQAQEIPARVC